MADLCTRFEKEYLPRKRPLTQRGYRQQIATDILPELRRVKVAAIGYADIDKLHRDLSKRAPIHANRVLALLSKMLSLAIRWGWRTDNPCRGIERNQEKKRRRYLTGEELLRLTAALALHRDQQAANIVRLLLLTGARRGEVLAAEWQQFNLEDGIWSKPGSTTKQRTDHIIPLSAPARLLLTELREPGKDGAEYVFPGRVGGHRLEIKDSWASICKSAGASPGCAFTTCGTHSRVAWPTPALVCTSSAACSDTRRRRRRIDTRICWTILCARQPSALVQSSAECADCAVEGRTECVNHATQGVVSFQSIAQ